MLSVFSLASGTQGVWESLSEWYQGSLIKELLDHLTDRYFSVDLYVYDNFSFATGTAGKLQSIIFAVVIGMLLASIITVYLRAVPGGFVRALLKAEANSPESAATLRQLGYFRSSAIRRELSRGVNLRRVVMQAEEVAGHAQESGEVSKNDTHPQKIDFLTARFYIPEELRFRAENRYNTKGSDLRLLILTPIIVLILAALVGYFLPDILLFADNIINMMSS